MRRHALASSEGIDVDGSVETGNAPSGPLEFKNAAAQFLQTALIGNRMCERVSSREAVPGVPIRTPLILTAIELRTVPLAVP